MKKIKGILRKRETWVKGGKGVLRGIRKTHAILTSPKAKETYRKIQKFSEEYARKQDIAEKRERKRRKKWRDYDKSIGF